MTRAMLAATTHFSLKNSIIKPNRLGGLAKERGYDAVGIADTMNINGLVDLTKSCAKYGVKPIIGCRIAVFDDPSLKETKAEAKAAENPNIAWYPKLYAKNKAGLDAIIKLVGRANLEDYFYYVPRTGLNELIEVVSSGNVILLTGDVYGLFSHKLYNDIACKLFASCALSDAYIEIVPQKTPLYDNANKKAYKYANDHDMQMAVSVPALYENDADADSLDVLCAVASLDSMSSVFTKRHYLRNQSFKSYDEIKGMCDEMCDRIGFDKHQIYTALDNNSHIADACTYEWKELPVSLPKMADDESAALIEKIKQGWESRLQTEIFGYKPTKEQLPIYKERLKYELKILRDMKFERYFLMVSDIVNWSKNNHVYVGPGRGSCGGSLISYLIGITDVDPIRFNLLFERFINPSRLDLPDVDLDFASSKRHKVIKYIADRFGEENVAGISNYVTVGAASGIRDVGRVYDIPPYDMACTKLMPKDHGSAIEIDEAAKMVPEIEKFKLANPTVWKHAASLFGVLRNYGKHAAGIVVAGEPVSNRAIVERRGSEMLVNWDKNSVEKQGLIKVDILGLATLDILYIARSSVLKTEGVLIDYLKIPLDDPVVLDAFGEGKTIGVFQFEGHGVRGLLRKLSRDQALTFDDLAAATALYRPGPMDAGLMDEYIYVKQGADVVYDHPKMENALKDTGGVFIFQEQVMQLARDLAGFTMAEADNLRKAMGKKDKDKMAAMRDQWIAGCVKESAMTETEAERLFNQVEKFAGYGFNKSHSVEYALISYLSMWIKTHYPVNFFSAAMSVLKEDKMAALIKDANAHGIEVYPPDINVSTDKFEIKELADGKNVLVAPLNRVKGISDVSAIKIVEIRKGKGGFESKEDFFNSVTGRQCNSKVREVLDAIGAFASLEPDGLPARHPDRLKAQIEYLPEISTSYVYVSRKMNRSPTVATMLGQLYGGMRECEGCSLKGGVHPMPTFGKRADIMIVTDSPNKDEDRNNKMFTGNGADFIKVAMKSAGLATNRGYYTSLVKSQKTGKFLTNEQINNCTHHLDEEIRILKPAVIVLLGNSAIRRFLPGEKKPKEAMCKVIYSKEYDANIVVGMNPATIWFSDDRQNDLNEVFQKVAEIL